MSVAAIPGQDPGAKPGQEALRPPEAANLWSSIQAFLRWLDQNGYESYDPYDIWGTRYGLFSRRIYYGHRLLGSPLIAPILLMEVLCPSLRRWLVGKGRFATADAQLLLGFLNLYEAKGGSIFLEKARALSRDLLQISVPGYSGFCWGYPFDWQHNRGLWKKNLPFITATPYCFEAFLRLFDLTADPAFLTIARSIAQFVHKDLRDTPTSPNAAAASYSPVDSSQVVNASAYRAMVLFEAADRFQIEDYRQTASRNLNFILQNQNQDGSWLYAVDHASERFIDHFHTCFVLKNLAKINRRLKSAEITGAVARGYKYYRSALYDSSGMPKQFAIRPRTQIVRFELYDFAEAISLGCWLWPEIPEALDVARRLAGTVRDRFQTASGHFLTRVYKGGLKHRFPYLRWPQAQLFYALTSLTLLNAKTDFPHNSR
ncbi:MAG: hypothetical protein ABSH38_03290 [Verrucomicrobiota bacterium]|jgi:hypothetical protein